MSLFGLFLSGTVLQPFFVFWDLDIFEEYTLFCRLSFYLGLSNLKMRIWLQILAEIWREMSQLMLGDMRNWFVPLIGVSTLSTWLRWCMCLLSSWIFACHLCYRASDTTNSKYFIHQFTYIVPTACIFCYIFRDFIWGFIIIFYLLNCSITEYNVSSTLLFFSITCYRKVPNWRLF